MTEAQATKALSDMLPRLYGWVLELDRIEEPSPKDRTRPYPPAPEADIAAAERKLKFKFPPSYRAFLKLHNGWKNFSFDWWVLGVSGPGAEAGLKALARDCASFEKRYGKRREELRAKSKTDAEVMYWPDHVPCAVDFNGGFRVFDRNRPLDGGEYEIAEVDRAEEAANRLPNFIAFVERAMKIVRRELETHGRKPDAIPPVSPDSAADGTASVAVKRTPAAKKVVAKKRPTAKKSSRRKTAR